MNTVFFGHHATGVWNVYPSYMQDRTATGGCKAYDPRVRPWYVERASGPKDVILVIDQSGSMDAVDSSVRCWTRSSTAMAYVLDSILNDRCNIMRPEHSPLHSRMKRVPEHILS